jgi:Fe2+ or Zn2+ uptake regulation protein
VGDLHLEALKNVSQKLAPELDFEVEMEQLILYGKCSECRKK